MSLILKQETASSVPTPPVGKGTLFLNDSDILTVKNSSGTDTYFPTVSATDTQVPYVSAGGLSGSGNLTFNSTSKVLTVLGNIEATGVKTSNLYYANGQPWDLEQPAGSTTYIQYNNSSQFGASANFTYNDSTQLFTVLGNVQFNNANLGNAATANYITGTITTASQPNITSVGTLNALNVNSTVTALAFTANTGVFTGNGAGLTNLVGANVSGAVAFATTANSVAGANVSGAVAFATTANSVAGANVSGAVAYATTANSVAGANVSGAVPFATTANAVAGANVSGQVSNALIAGTVYTAAQPNITSTGTLTSLSVSGNANVGNIGTTNLVATGTGSFSGNINMNTFFINNLGTPSANADAATKAYVDGLVSTGLYYHPSVNAATTTTLATTTGGTITYNNGTAGVNANLVTTGSYTLVDNVNIASVGARILVKNEANAAWNGVYTYANSTTIVRSTDTDSYGTGPGDLSENDYFFVPAGTVNAGTAYVCSTTGTITFGTTNINFSLFSTSQVYANGTGLGLSGTTFSVLASQTQITAVGTLTTLSISGNANVGNLGTAGSVIASTLTSNVATGTAPFTVTSTTQVANLSVATAGSATTAGTVTTNAQPNITSVGTLTSLSVSGNITSGNISATTHTGTTSNITGQYISTVATGTAPLVVSSTTQVANLSVATSGSATTAGTVTTAAQPNITSVGTLSTLSVSGNANVGNIGATTGIYTTLQATTITTGANTTAGTVTGNFTLSAGSRHQATYA